MIRTLDQRFIGNFSFIANIFSIIITIIRHNLKSIPRSRLFECKQTKLKVETKESNTVYKFILFLKALKDGNSLLSVERTFHDQRAIEGV